MMMIATTSMTQVWRFFSHYCKDDFGLVKEAFDHLQAAIDGQLERENYRRRKKESAMGNTTNVPEVPPTKTGKVSD